MKVLQIHHGDDYRWGGGIIAMLRLHEGLRRAGVDSRMLCGVKTRLSPDSLAIPRPRRLEGALRRLIRPLGLNDLHCVSSFTIPRLPAVQSADVLHLQGLHGGFFSYLALPRLTHVRPTVYTLHDMWSFTGHCAYSYDCRRWTTGCGRCPHLDTNPAVARDATRLEWKLKNLAYRRSRFVVVTISSWLTAAVRESMLGTFPVREIANGVDTDVYRPLDRALCRDLLGIPRSARVIMTAAMTLDAAHPEGFRKGGDLLLAALETLPPSLRAELVLLLMGTRGEALAAASGLSTVNLGHIGSDHLKAIAYSAADLLVFPTRADSGGLVVLESMACGTPAVSFRVGGVPDIVRPGVTGDLAEPQDARGLASAITRLLDDPALRERLGQSCRTVATQEFSLDAHVQQYLRLYQDVTQGVAAA